MHAPFFEFSSEAYPVGERFDGWRDEFGRRVLGINFSRDPEAPFWARTKLCGSAGVSFGDFELSACSTERSKESLPDGRHDLFCVIAMSGPLRCIQRGRDIVLGPRTLTFMRSDEVGVIECARSRPITSYRVIGMEIGQMSSRLRCLDDVFAKPVDAADPGVSLLVSYAGFISQHAPSAQPNEMPVMMNHAVDLMALALGPRRDGLEQIRQNGLRAARLAELKAALAQHAGNPRLTAERLGVLCNISERYVQSIFESAGTTFSETLLATRLENVRALLIDRTCELPVSQIAPLCGFSDVSHFNRSFKRRFGITPREMRHGAGRRS